MYVAAKTIKSTFLSDGFDRGGLAENTIKEWLAEYSPNAESVSHPTIKAQSAVLHRNGDGSSDYHFENDDKGRDAFAVCGIISMADGSTMADKIAIFRLKREARKLVANILIGESQ